LIISKITTSKVELVTWWSNKEESIEKFKEQFDKKGRGLIEVGTEIKDIKNTSTCRASFTWFVQSI